jgi:uncharacterized glyoxalase superfamily protein PhnB
MTITNRSAPRATIVPILVYQDVDAALDWLQRVGFVERLRALGPDGRVTHAQLDFGEGSVMIGKEAGPFHRPPAGIVSQLVHVAVTDADAHFDRAKSAGLSVLREPATMPFGERQYTLQDLEGHWWVFSQHVADLAPEDWGAQSASAATPAG